MTNETFAQVSVLREGRRELELDPDNVVVMEGNRAVDLAGIQDLMASIHDVGQLNPGQVRNLPEQQKWLCLAGHRRLAACRYLGRPFRAIEVEGDPDPGMLLKLAITDNALRKQLSLLDLADAIGRYAKVTGLVTQSELAEALCLSQSEVSRALALPMKLAPDLHSVVRDRAVPRTFVELIASVPDHERQRELLEWVLTAKPKRESLQRRIAELRGQKRKLQKPLKFRHGGCSLELKNPTAETLQAFLDAVSAALKKANKDGLTLSVVDSLIKSPGPKG